MTRILIQGSRGKTAWTGFTLQAAGDLPVRGIACWGLGAKDVLEPPAGLPVLNAFTPFDLLPRESFSLTADSSEGAAGALRGFFLWELPPSRAALIGALRRNHGLDWNTTHGLLLGLRGPVFFELSCSAPLPHVHAALAWDFDAPAVTPEIWLSTEASTWGRLPGVRRRDPWENPYDFSRHVAGKRRFALRIAVPAEELAGNPVILRRLRIEREVAGPGNMRIFRPGLNEISFTTASGSGPLQFALTGGE